MSTQTQSAYLAPDATSQWRPLILWHLLSLDAPTVALVWCALFNWNAHLPMLPALTLALAVWILYAVDRLLDARHSGRVLQERHHFHHMHRVAFTIAVCMACGLLPIATILLEGYIQRGWLLLGIPLAAYFLLVHGTRITLPKEAVVAVFFAAACSLPSALTQKSWSCTGNVVLFCIVCWANCIAIARWEQEPHGHPLTHFAAAHLRLICGLLFTVALCFAPFSDHCDIPLCVMLSASMLLCLDVVRCHFSRVALRSMADALLLTPLLVLPFLHESPMAVALRHLLQG